MKKLMLVCLVLVSFLLPIAGISTVRADSSHQVVGRSTPPDTFATTDHGCLGPLRSQIAQGQFNGVGPFGDHFNGIVNPGAHYGTAGEASFLTTVIGVTDLDAFCSSIASGKN